MQPPTPWYKETQESRKGQPKGLPRLTTLRWGCLGVNGCSAAWGFASWLSSLPAMKYIPLYFLLTSARLVQELYHTRQRCTSHPPVVTKEAAVPHPYPHNPFLSCVFCSGVPCCIFIGWKINYRRVLQILKLMLTDFFRRTHFVFHVVPHICVNISAGKNGTDHVAKEKYMQIFSNKTKDGWLPT